MIIGVWGALAQVWNTVFMLFIDKVGRRKLLIPSLLGMGATMCVEATLARYVNFSNGNANPDALRAAIAMFYVFSLFFTSLGIISWIYQSEIFPTAIRARGSSAATATNWSLNLVFAQCSPIALSSIGYKFFYCFVAFNWTAMFLVWFFYPETVGRSLEEVDDVFEEKDHHDHILPTSEITSSPSTALAPRSHLRLKGLDPLSMHPSCQSSSGSSRSGRHGTESAND